jgi:hypothetical protein
VLVEEVDLIVEMVEASEELLLAPPERCGTALGDLVRAESRAGRNTSRAHSE